MAPRAAALVRRFGTKAVVASGLLVVTVALAGYQTLGVATPIWVLAALFFIQGAGMGTVMPPATEAVMSVVPRERAGSGSALTNVARQVAGALGVAVLGSILAPGLPGPAQPASDRLPAAAKGDAAGSIAGTQAVAAKLGAGSPAGRGPGKRSPITPSCTPCISPPSSSAVITLLGALVVVIWMPGTLLPAPGRPADAAPSAGAAECGRPGGAGPGGRWDPGEPGHTGTHQFTPPVTSGRHGPCQVAGGPTVDGCDNRPVVCRPPGQHAPSPVRAEG